MSYCTVMARRGGLMKQSLTEPETHRSSHCARTVFFHICSANERPPAQDWWPPFRSSTPELCTVSALLVIHARICAPPAAPIWRYTQLQAQTRLEASSLKIHCLDIYV